MEMQRTLDGKPADTYVGISIARDGANPRIIEYYAQLVKHLRGASTRQIFPITNSIEAVSEKGDGNNISTGCISTRNQSGQANWDGSTTLISNAIDSNYYKGIDNHGQRTAILCDSGQGRKDQLWNATIAPLRANTGAGHNNIVVKRAPLKFADRNQKNYDEGDYAFTIDSCNTGGIEITEEQYDGTYNKNIRRLTPIECERLQGFPQLESYININIHNTTICVDLQKSYVNVEIRNHKQQKYAGNVEKSEVKENVSYVEQNLNTNNLPINKPAQKNVVINCVEETVEIHNQKKSYSFANYVESQNSYLQHIKTEDFVHLLVGINITLKNAMHFGKEVLHQNEQYLIQVQNGKLFVKLYGREMMQSANDAKTDLTTLKKHLKYITSNHLNLESVDYNWIISYCYVINAITGCIQTKTQINNLLNLEIKTVFGYTFGISDTQRYKCLGNAVTVNVIEFIYRHIMEAVE